MSRTFSLSFFAVALIAFAGCSSTPGAKSDARAEDAATDSGVGADIAAEVPEATDTATAADGGTDRGVEADIIDAGAEGTTDGGAVDRILVDRGSVDGLVPFTIFAIGDSTMADYDVTTFPNQRGWGQMSRSSWSAIP